MWPSSALRSYSSRSRKTHLGTQLRIPLETWTIFLIMDLIMDLAVMNRDLLKSSIFNTRTYDHREQQLH